jgi:asparaginyl-tRNA synthetase
VIFVDVVDSTGTVQAVIDKLTLDKPEVHYEELKPEASLIVRGTKRPNHKTEHEILVADFRVIGQAKLDLRPRPRNCGDLFANNHADHILRNRHFYLRNEKQSAVLRFKSLFVFEAHRYLVERGFVFIDAPVLTQLLLYDDDTAFRVQYNDRKNREHEVFLSQCCTFQLEAAVHAFEKVYNVTPSFRAEHSKSNRHLREYWHLKIEIAWADLDDLIRFASDLVYTVSRRTSERAQRELDILGIDFDENKLAPTYPIVSYDEVVELVRKSGRQFEWGKSLCVEDEKLITESCGHRPVWVKGIPCSAEAFPFSRDPEDPTITRTCDLIAPHGFGEVLGTAEKITSRSDLLARMAEKGRSGTEQLTRYGWYLDLRDYGIVPHGGIGMGVERVVRFLLRLPHIRYTTSFPRLFGRIPNP